MKKSLAVILSMLFVLGLAVSAFAIHAEIPSETQSVVAKGATQITLGGELRMRGEFKKNTSDFNSDHGDTSAVYDGRVRLHLDAQITPNTQGYVQLESAGCSGNVSVPVLDEDGEPTGEFEDVSCGEFNGDLGRDGKDTYTWGESSFATGNNGHGLGNAKRGDLRILQAWIQHTGSGLLGVPAGMKIGHMPIKLGNGLFLDHSKFGDDAILLFADPTNELHVVLATAKLNEISATSSDDHTGYVGILGYKGDGFNAGADITYVDLQRPGIGSPDEGLHFWNIGLNGDTTVSGIKLYADLELQTGKAKNAFEDGGDLKFRGYAWMVGGSYSMDPLTVGLEAAYGSGDKVDENDDSGDKDESFLTTLGADQHYTYVYEYRARTAANGLLGGSGTATGLANTWYIKGSASMKPMPDLTTYLALYYLRAAKSVNIFHLANDTGALDSEGNVKKSKNIGFEVDAKLTYQIDKNLVYFIEGGYLFAGSAYDSNPTQEEEGNVSSDNAYAVRHGVTLSF